MVTITAPTTATVIGNSMGNAPVVSIVSRMPVNGARATVANATPIPANANAVGGMSAAGSQLPNRMPYAAPANAPSANTGVKYPPGVPAAIDKGPMKNRIRKMTVNADSANLPSMTS